MAQDVWRRDPRIEPAALWAQWQSTTPTHPDTCRHGCHRLREWLMNVADTTPSAVAVFLCVLFSWVFGKYAQWGADLEKTLCRFAYDIHQMHPATIIGDYTAPLMDLYDPMLPCLLTNEWFRSHPRVCLDGLIKTCVKAMPDLQSWRPPPTPRMVQSQLERHVQSDDWHGTRRTSYKYHKLVTLLTWWAGGRRHERIPQDIVSQFCDQIHYKLWASLTTSAGIDWERSHERWALVFSAPSMQSGWPAQMARTMSTITASEFDNWAQCLNLLETDSPFLPSPPDWNRDRIVSESAGLYRRAIGNVGVIWAKLALDRVDLAKDWDRAPVPAP